jgi:hypothetical protein
MQQDHVGTTALHFVVKLKGVLMSEGKFHAILPGRSIRARITGLEIE